MIKKIEYEDKQAIQNDDSIQHKNKVTADDMNEIKNVVNTNVEEFEAVKETVENNNTDIATLTNDNNKNKTDIKNLQTDNTTNKKSIEELKQKNAEQDESIETNESEIENLKQENIEIKAENERLRNDIKSIALVGEESGESIDLEDSSEARFNKFEIWGNHKQETREGYNKFKPFESSNVVSANGTTVKIENEKITINGACTKQWWCEIYYRFGDGTTVQTEKKEELDSSKTYTFALQRMSGDITQGYVNATVVIDENNTQIGGPAIAASNKDGTSKTFNNGNGLYRAYLYIPQNAVFNNLELGVLICEGSENKKWEQYGAMPSLEFPSEIKTVKDNINEVICNKNYIDNDNTSKTIDGVTFIKNEDGSILVNGTPTKDVSYPIQSKFKKYKDGEYFLSGCPAGGSSSSFGMILWNENWTSIASDYGTGRKITLTAQKAKLHLSIKAGTICNNLLFKPQFEKNSVATAYVKHQSQSIAMPVQQEMLDGDYFDWENEKEVHKWTKLILDGTEKIRLSNNNISFVCDVSNNVKISSNDEMPPVASNSYKTATWRDRNANNIKNTISMFASSIGLDKGDLTTVDEFKAMLKSKYDAGNAVVIYYELETPTELEFTDEQKEAAKQIKQTLHTYKNITHIYSEDEISPKIDIEYAKDLNTVINNIQAQIINNASEEV